MPCRGNVCGKGTALELVLVLAKQFASETNKGSIVLCDTQSLQGVLVV